MKKLAIMFAGILCLIVTSCIKETPCAYQITRVTEDSHYTGTPGSPASVIYRSYLEELKAFDQKYQGTMTWLVIVKNGKVSGYDNDADAKFQAFDEELQDIVDKYQAQVDDCIDLKYSFRHEFSLILTRIYLGEKILESKTYNLSYRE